MSYPIQSEAKAALEAQVNKMGKKDYLQDAKEITNTSNKVSVDTLVCNTLIAIAEELRLIRKQLGHLLQEKASK